MKQIRLFKTTKGWMADFVGDKDMLELFGSTIVPTAFTAQADQMFVLKEISNLNPHCEVILA
mgnify:FL=1